MSYETVFTDFDRLFDGFNRGFWAPVVRGEAVGTAPTYDITESEQGYLLSLDVPGIPNDRIKIEVVDRTLKISGERKKSGKFERMFSLPNEVDVDRIQARQENGVLELMLPKHEKAQPKTIKIETGGGESFFSKMIGKREDA